jgi:hypothetical protein
MKDEGRGVLNEGRETGKVDQFSKNYNIIGRMMLRIDCYKAFLNQAITSLLF